MTTLQKKTRTQKTADQTAQKHALGVLHRMHEKYTLLAEPDQHFTGEIYDAFRILARTVHGEPTGRQHGGLCDECHETYYTHWVDMPHPTLSNFPTLRFCCTSCKDRLLAEGNVTMVDGQPIPPQKSEVSA